MLIGKLQEGKAHLHALDLNISLNKGQTFTDKGYVPYIGMNYNSLYGGYGGYEGYGNHEGKYEQRTILGKCGVNCDLSHVEIFYLKKPPMKTLFTRGHEEGHSLFYLGRLYELYQEFKNAYLDPRAISFSLKKAKQHDRIIKSILKDHSDLRLNEGDLFGNNELLADLSGILALKKKGFAERSIHRFIRREEQKYPSLYYPSLALS